MLDAVDRQIIHTLAVHPRASFRTIADVAQISDQTAARRYRRLAESTGLRVLGVPDGTRLGWVNWFLRLQTTPGSAETMAEALARRSDTRWVSIASAGTEIICEFEARTAEQRDALFLRGLPGSRRIVQISAHSILHNYVPHAWPELTKALSADQLALLARDSRPSGPVPADLAASSALLPEDEPLLAELARDGRASHAALAAAIHWHESTVRRRIDELRQAGLLYFEVDIDGRGLGITVSASLWLTVEPARLEEAGRAVASHPEVPFAAATSGSTNLIVTGLFRDTEHLYEYLTGRLASLPGVRSVETAPVIRTLKRTGSVYRQRNAGSLTPLKGKLPASAGLPALPVRVTGSATASTFPA
jgi:DNA-binding Lrp family transcriptional regulator